MLLFFSHMKALKQFCECIRIVYDKAINIYDAKAVKDQEVNGIMANITVMP